MVAILCLHCTHSFRLPSIRGGLRLRVATPEWCAATCIVRSKGLFVTGTDLSLFFSAGRTATTINTLPPFGLFAIACLESVNYLSESEAEISRPGSFAEPLSTMTWLSEEGGHLDELNSTSATSTCQQGLVRAELLIWEFSCFYPTSSVSPQSQCGKSFYGLHYCGSDRTSRSASPSARREGGRGRGRRDTLKIWPN